MYIGNLNYYQVKGEVRLICSSSLNGFHNEVGQKEILSLKNRTKRKKSVGNIRRLLWEGGAPAADGKLSIFPEWVFSACIRKKLARILLSQPLFC